MRSRFPFPSFLLLALAAISSGTGWARSGTDLKNAAVGRSGAEVKRAIPPYKEPTQKQNLRTYLKQMVSPYALGSVAFVSGLHQAEHHPSEWQEGMAGFGERLASNFGTPAAGP